MLFIYVLLTLIDIPKIVAYLSLLRWSHALRSDQNDSQHEIDQILYRPAVTQVRTKEANLFIDSLHSSLNPEEPSQSLCKELAGQAFVDSNINHDSVQCSMFSGEEETSNTDQEMTSNEPFSLGTQ